MQSQAPRRRLKARRAAAVSGGPVAAAAAAAGAAPGLAVAAEPSICRICWQEGDGEPGGALLTPCRCAGSQKHVHERCLAEWMASVAQRKGVPQARRCDVCRALYQGLPRDMRLRETPQAYVRRQTAALLRSPLGTALSYYSAGGLVFSVLLSVHGAWCRLAALPAVLRAARVDPLRALGADVALAAASEALLSGQWLLPLLSAFRFGQGLLLQEVAAWVQAHGVRALPPPLSLPLHLACEAARLAAVAMQYTHGALLLLFGGLARGFVRGAVIATLAPLRAAGSAAAALRHAAAAAAARLAARRPRRRKQQQQ
ncbi:ring finger membrane [Micractinium conductrix]|uniref:Ring finger membrane n=1 Tax=Micractinium conductrix TaxID=554055 RepID=A0A2P6VMM6_9CHLO|nr:ring finger membrane [Micractinium conductrix]|eukprot:PSC75339.1 ring finger membrane [Micractinium conductrix]